MHRLGLWCSHPTSLAGQRLELCLTQHRHAAWPTDRAGLPSWQEEGSAARVLGQDMRAWDAHMQAQWFAIFAHHGIVSCLPAGGHMDQRARAWLTRSRRGHARVWATTSRTLSPVHACCMGMPSWLHRGRRPQCMLRRMIPARFPHSHERQLAAAKAGPCGHSTRLCLQVTLGAGLLLDSHKVASRRRPGVTVARALRETVQGRSMQRSGVAAQGPG